MPSGWNLRNGHLWIKNPNIDGFKVGDRVVYARHIGTVIALAEEGSVGVEFDEPGIGYHDCGGVRIKAGHMGTKGNSIWLSPKAIRHFRDASEDVVKYVG